jgi:hypothetical protein
MEKRIPEGYTLSFVLLLCVPAVRYRRTVQKTLEHVTVL